MLGICLKILSILGILLLVLPALLLGGILLVLFFPFSYRFCGLKKEEEFRIAARVGWLGGLFRAECDYPEPGRIKVRVLFFTLFDQPLIFAGEGEKNSSGGKTGSPGKEKRKKKAGKRKKRKTSQKEEASGRERSSEKEEAFGREMPSEKEEFSERKSLSEGELFSEKDARSEKERSSGREISSENEELSGNKEDSDFSSKIKKIKYTICNIYDKIKKIREKISCYAGLFRKEETKLLLSDFLAALGKIGRNIRPRHVKADIRFGAGAPDTTGYIYGMYCMLSAFWGPGICVTPDFEKAVLEGEFDISGRITAVVLLMNGWKMYKHIRKLTATVKASV